MNGKTAKPKDWDHSEDENKKIIRTVFSKMGGDKSKISVRKTEYAMEVRHQDFEQPVILTRQYFDDKNLQAIGKMLSHFWERT